MRRRLLRAITVVAALTVTLFGIPLAIAVSQLYQNDEVIRLEREAAQAGQQVGLEVGGGDPVELPSGRSGSIVGLYDRQGRRIEGRGPRRGDAIVTRALAGTVADSVSSDQLVVGVPVSRAERIIGVVRAARARSYATSRAHRAWIVMLGLGGVAVAVAALSAVVLSRRLARPIERLSGSAARLGSGNFALVEQRSGIPEIDAADAALRRTAQRLAGVLGRERAFSADASHQLRTPLAALRLDIETELIGDPEPRARAVLERSLIQVDRLQETTTALLQLARDAPRGGAATDVAAVLSDARDHWQSTLAARGRPLRVLTPADLAPVSISASALKEILAVLLDNATSHGSGVVNVTVRQAHDVVRIDVTDEGSGVANEPDLFRRRAAGGGGHGIGLTLARSLAEAEGGRLSYAAAAQTTTFTLMLTTQPVTSSR